MMKIDRFTKIVLAVIALALTILALRGGTGLGLQSEAQAQGFFAPVQLVHVRDIPVKDFKEVILLGDGKTFLLRVDAGIGVYQVQ